MISAMFRTGKLMGTIRIDGAATSEISLKTLRSSMSVIPQVRKTEFYTQKWVYEDEKGFWLL